VAYRHGKLPASPPNRARPAAKCATIAIAVLLATILAPHTSAWADTGSRHIIVKFESQGPHALDECAETLFRRNRSFASGTRDRSGSLDALKARTAVRSVHALFRRPDGRPLSDQRARLKQSLQTRVRKTGLSMTPRASSKPLPDLSHIYRVRVGEEVNPEIAIALYSQDPHVAWVQRDHSQQLDTIPDEPPFGAEPNDPFFRSMGNWNQNFGDLWGLHRVRAPEAWAETRGEGIVVAVVDTGVDYNHPDIEGNIWVNPGEDLNGNRRVDPEEWNGIDDDGNGFVDDLRGFDFANSIDADLDGYYDGPLDVGDSDPYDDRGHGTHVAGTIAAIANNGIGIIGVAPAARIMALKGFPAEGEGLDSNLWRAVLYAARNGARVVNASWSCNPLCPRNPLAEEIVQIVRDMGVIVVTSAGNRSTDVVSNSPENTRNVLTVGSSGADDEPSESFTNFGWLLDVAAPGGGPSTDPNVYVARRNILSLRASEDEGAEPFAVGNGYARSAGTSMAAPHVSGAVALLLSAHPNLDYETVRRLIRQGAADLGPPGHDRHMGAGRLDALGSLAEYPLPDLHAVLDSPRAGSVFRPGHPPHSPEAPQDDSGDEDSQSPLAAPRRFQGELRSLAHAPREGTVIAIRGTASGQGMLDYTLSYGRGNEPDHWQAIVPARSAAVRQGILGHWDITDAEQGTYVIRLEVRGVEGHVYREFIPLSLERNPSMPLSSEGPPATLPEISGRFLTFRSLRSPDSPPAKAEDSNLFVADFLSGQQWTLAGGPGHDQMGSVSRAVGARVHGNRGANKNLTAPAGRGKGHRRRRSPDLIASWSRIVSGSSSLQGFGCRLDLRTGRCDEFSLSSDTGSSLLPVSARGRIFWLAAGDDGKSTLRGCRPNRAGTQCVEYDLGLPPARRSFLQTDGETLNWIEHQGGQRIGLCPIDPKTGACPALLLPDAISPYSRVTVSGRLVAWVEFRFSRKQPLLLCEFDAETGACPPIEVAPDVRDSAPRLSGNRLVWDGHIGDEASDVFYCEFDRILRQCPVQRLTAEMTAQAHSNIDGLRVVWQDERRGSSTIFGTVLPHFDASNEAERRVRAGEKLKIRVQAESGSSSDPSRRSRGEDAPSRGRAGPEAMAISLEARRSSASGLVRVSLDSLDVRFDDDGKGRGRLRWRPHGSDAGDYVFTFAAETRDGLITRSSFRVHIEPRSESRPREDRRRGRGRGRNRGGRSH
jgi:subtilisin family serine protease